MNWPIITVIDFADNSWLIWALDIKWDEKWLTEKEKTETRYTLWENISNILRRFWVKSSDFELNVINLLEDKTFPKELIWDAFIVWWFPQLDENTSREYLLKIQSLVRNIVEIKNKPYLGMCFWHQLLAEAFWWKTEHMPRRVLGTGSFFLNTQGEWDNLFWAIWKKEIQSIWRHRRKLISVSSDAQVLWWNNDSSYQAIKIWDKAWWMQCHPDFTSDGTIWRIKLWNKKIIADWYNIEELIKKLESPNFTNDASQILVEFINKAIKGELK